MTLLVGLQFEVVSYKNTQCCNGIRILTVEDTHKPDHYSLATSIQQARMSWV